MANAPSEYSISDSVDVENKIPDTVKKNEPIQIKRTRKPVKNKRAITRTPKSLNSAKKKLRSNDLKDVCRICLLAEDDMVSMISKYGSDCVADMFQSITSVEVDQEDNLPLSICGSCSNKLVDCYAFKVQCLESNSILQSKIGKNKNDKSKRDSSIASKKDKETQTCVDDYDIKEEDNYLEIKDSDSQTEADNDDENEDEEIEFLEEDSYLEDSIKTDIEKKIQQITYKFLTERKNQNCVKKKQLSCSKCLKKFLKLKTLRAHSKVCKKSIRSEFRCSQCPQYFDSANDLKIHSAVHVKGRQWKCVECEKEFTDRSRFRRHIRRHMDTMKRWSCSDCGKTFTELCALRRHTRVHTGETKEKRFPCMLCDKKFADKNQLIEHSANHTGERPCTCDDCGKTFASSRLLASHRRVHSDYLPYECAYCDRRFRMKSTRTTHHRTHTGERPYVCTVCGKRFIQASNLSLHMRTHTGEKPYSCGVCGRKFASGSSLAVHMRTHTGEKPYSCPICGKRFARTDIKAHLRLHTGERPYACAVCPKRFVSSAALREHSVVHTGERRFQCTLCPEKYKKKIYLMNHMDKVHGKDNEAKQSHIKIQSYIIDASGESNEGEGVRNETNTDVILLGRPGELISPEADDFNTTGEEQYINSQNNSDEILNEVVLSDELNISREVEMNEAESVLEGTRVNVYQLDETMQVKSCGKVTIRKIAI